MLRTHLRRFVYFAAALLCQVLMLPVAKLIMDDIRITPTTGRGVIIAANHRSLLDFFVGLIAFRRWAVRPRTFVRADFLEVPFVGTVLRWLGGIPAGPGHAATGLRQAKDELEQGNVVVITPEGRIPRPDERKGAVVTLRPGVGRLASLAATPILLVAISNSDLAWPRGKTIPNVHMRLNRRPTVRLSTCWLHVNERMSAGDVNDAVAKGLTDPLDQLGVQARVQSDSPVL